MGSFSIFHWLIMLIFGIVFVFPVWRIAVKAGYSGAWSLLLFLPLFNVIILWIFAFSTWPVEKK